MPRALSMILFLTCALTFVALLHWYFAVRIARDTMLGPRAVLGLKVFFACAGLSIPAVFLLSRLLPLDLARPVTFPMYLWMGAMIYLGLGLGLLDLLGLGLRLVAPRGSALASLFAPEHRALWSRGVALVAVVATAVICAVGVVRARGEPTVTRLTLRLAGWPSALDGLTVAQLTDLHIGGGLHREWLARVVALTNAARPDLVALTGDLVDGPVSRLKGEVAPLRDLKAPLGVFFVTGNHEYYSGVRPWLAHLPGLGLRVLANERVAIARDGAAFDLVGVNDHNGGDHDDGTGPDFHAALAGRDPARPWILLAHQPREALAGARHGAALALVGHTHGGQIWPWSLAVRLQQPLVAGLSKEDGTFIWVSQGTGYWGVPMRVGTRGEITLVTLRPPR